LQTFSIQSLLGGCLEQLFVCPVPRTDEEETPISCGRFSLTDYSLFRYIQLIPKRVLINIYQYQFNEWDKGNNDAIEWLEKDPKHQIIGLPYSEPEKARQLEKPHYDEWLSVARKGFDGEKLLDKVRSLARKCAD
jgi:hypothetical protein